MHRKALADIEKWNLLHPRKPLILIGARQVGKSWLMDEFSRLHYPQDTVKVNFMTNERLREQFEGINLDAQTVLETLGIETGRKIVPGKTLLVMDEIQESPRALTCLKFLNEQVPELAVMVAGSLLGLAVNRKKRKKDESRASFPVGKVSFIDVPPMTFGEFLLAVGEEMKYEQIAKRNWKALESFHQAYGDLLKKYLFVGGMPEAVATYVKTRDMADVRLIHQEILAAYDADFAKHASGALLAKIRLLWNSIPSQLTKENKKFVYTALRPGARAREYEVALQWLDDAGMIRQVCGVSTPKMPLKAYEEFGAFKLYAHDVGLVAALASLPQQALLEGNAIFTHFKGALTEQYVLQELTAMGMSPFYWSPDNVRAEVEFVLQGATGVYPLEAKAERNLKAKSLKSYRDRFQPSVCLRTSMAKRTDGESVHDYPLYAVETLVDEIV